MSNSINTTVIGGTGFIGNSLLPQLLTNERNVSVIGRKSRPPFLDSRVTYIKSDDEDEQELAKILANANEIIDLSYTTNPKTSFDDPVSDIVNNLPRAAALFEVCKKLEHLRKLVIISSGGAVYGDKPARPILESEETQPISPYGITKLTIEKYAYLYSKLYRLPIITLRPSNAYGPRIITNDSQGFINVALNKVRHGLNVPIFGKHGVVRDYIHVGDIASAITKTLDLGKLGSIYNVGTGIGTNNLDLLSLITKIVKSDGFECKFDIHPERSFDVKNNILDSRLLRHDTGWKPQVNLKEGIEQTWGALVNRS